MPAEELTSVVTVGVPATPAITASRGGATTASATWSASPTSAAYVVELLLAGVPKKSARVEHRWEACNSGVRQGGVLACAPTVGCSAHLVMHRGQVAAGAAMQAWHVGPPVLSPGTLHAHPAPCRPSSLLTQNSPSTHLPTCLQRRDILHPGV